MAAEIDFARTGDASCFGCGHANPDGLQLKFRQVADRTVELTVVVHPRFAGVPGVVHGGIQATLLDEVMGKAAYAAFPDSYEQTRFVTAELNVRYVRPAPAGVPLVARGQVTAVDERYVHVTASLYEASGEELTTATSTWRYTPLQEWRPSFGWRPG